MRFWSSLLLQKLNVFHWANYQIKGNQACALQLSICSFLFFFYPSRFFKSLNVGKEGKHSFLKLLHLFFKTSRGLCDQHKFSSISGLILFTLKNPCNKRIIAFVLSKFKSFSSRKRNHKYWWLMQWCYTRYLYLCFAFCYMYIFYMKTIVLF